MLLLLNERKSRGSSESDTHFFFFFVAVSNCKKEKKKKQDKMAETIEARFKKAVWLIRNGPAEKSSNETKLLFYSYFKQVKKEKKRAAEEAAKKRLRAPAKEEQIDRWFLRRKSDRMLGLLSPRVPVPLSAFRPSVGRRT